MRRAAVLAAGVVLALPGAARAETKPPLSVSARTLRHGDRLVIRGTGCPFTGLGAGYDADLVNRHRKHLDESPDTGDDGRWEGVHVIPTWLPGGRYTIEAQCYDAPQHNQYPRVEVVVLPEITRVDGPLTVSDTSVAPGATVRLTAPGMATWPAGVYLGERWIGELPVHPRTNDYTGLVTIPASTEPGTYRLAAQGQANDERRTLAATVTVAAPAPPPTTPPATRPPWSAAPGPTTPPATTAPAPTTPPATTAPATVAPTTEPPTPDATAAVVGFEEHPSSLPLLPIGAGVGGAAGVGAAALLVVRRRRARPVD
ncbi:MAG TPA: hypothetical protein VFQ85_01395 [Mycobacteriales bacterium]|jgi:hypothetical protein|nr:hypothetical protein [Mycobacteriales bacterium]